jgi:hypothetical protein
MNSLAATGDSWLFSRHAMNKTLVEQLPEIVRNGKRRAEQILESLEGKTRVGLQTRELVTPARDSNWKEFALARRSASGREGAAVKTAVAGGMGVPARADTGMEACATKHAEGARSWFNRLIYGDNLLAMAALLAGDEQTPSLRGWWYDPRTGKAESIGELPREGSHQFTPPPEAGAWTGCLCSTMLRRSTRHRGDAVESRGHARRMATMILQANANR